MSDMQTFPDTVDEFMEHYKIIDTEQVYTNGVEGDDTETVFRLSGMGLRWMRKQEGEKFLGGRR